MHQNKIIILAFSLCSFSLVGCQTTSTVIPSGIDPVQGLLALEVITDHCTGDVRSEHAAQKQNLWQIRTTIEELSLNDDGWILVNFTNSESYEPLIKGQASYNPQTLQSVCSANHENAKRSNALTIYSALISNRSSLTTNELRDKIKNYIRPIHFQWPEGKAQPVGEAVGVGKNDAYLRNNVYGYHKIKAAKYLERGWITVNSPYGACSGIYQLTERYPSKGIWNLYCPSKVSITGSFKLTNQVSYTDNPSSYYYENAEGIGTNNQGQTIRFSMPWRDGTSKYTPF